MALLWAGYGGEGGETEIDDSLLLPPITMPDMRGVALPCKCFAAGTPVWCPEGVRPIESIREGDLVLAYDLNERMVVESRVSRCEASQDEFNMLDVEACDGDRFCVTTEHAFYDGVDWVPSEDLAAAGFVLNADGRRVSVSATEPRRCERLTTYNLRTQHETYLVGFTGLVVADRNVHVSRKTGHTGGWRSSPGERNAAYYA